MHRSLVKVWTAVIYTLDDVNGESCRSWFWLEITKDVMTVRIVLHIRVGLYVVHLVDG